MRFFTPENQDKPEIHGGFALSHFCDSLECEEKIKADLTVSIRLLPCDRESQGEGNCMLCHKPSRGRVVFAKSY